VSFIGSHLDVVPANPAGWFVDPFVLKRDGDKLYGRGTTDCLGHVALLTDLFCTLAETRPTLDVTVCAVFIASEESNSIPDVGVEMLVKDHKLDFIKAGPVYWVDSADSQPCIGTAGVLTWTLRATGKLGHSGLPDCGINSIELVMDAVSEIQRRFYADFPAHPNEQKYAFRCQSSMKPTQIKVAEGSLNQIPPWCEVSGDIRFTPFYELHAVQEAVTRYVAELNENIANLPTRGPSKYSIKGAVGKVELKWAEDPYEGIACSTESEGFRALADATSAVIGEVKPYSIGGSLPLVKDLQKEGFDVQICGYGKSEVYHGDNEYCNLSDMKNATKIFSHVISTLNRTLNGAQ